MRVGLVGAGKIGQLRARSVRECPDTSLVAVFDPAPGAAARVAAGPAARFCATLDEFNDIPMDIVVVSSPVHVHEAPCLAAFARGRHVLCEKPLANTVEGCRRIVEAARAADRVLAVGFNLRYYPAIRQVKDAVAGGQIGRLDHVRIFGGHEGLPKFARDWEYRAPESGGGAMMDVGVHMTDVARFILGDITEVYGLMSEAIWHVPGSEDNAVAIFRNPDGVPATYEATWTEWKGYQFYVEAYGDKGMVRGAYAPMQTLLVTQERPGAPRHTSRRRFPWIMVREKLFTWQTTALLSFRDELRDLLAMIGGMSGVALADGHDGLRAVEVAEAVRTSSRTGAPVRLPPLGRMRP